MGMLILERPCQSATPVPQRKFILCYFSWKSMSVQQACLTSDPSHFKQHNRETEGTQRNGTQDVPAGARAFSDPVPRLFPCHLGFPLSPLIFERSLVMHIRVCLPL